MSIKFSFTLSDIEKLLKTGERTYMISPDDILSYLVNELHVLNPGYYLIEVSW